MCSIMLVGGTGWMHAEGLYFPVILKKRIEMKKNSVIMKKNIQMCK